MTSLFFFLFFFFVASHQTRRALVALSSVLVLRAREKIICCSKTFPRDICCLLHAPLPFAFRLVHFAARIASCSLAVCTLSLLQPACWHQSVVVENCQPMSDPPVAVSLSRSFAAVGQAAVLGAKSAEGRPPLRSAPPRRLNPSRRWLTPMATAPPRC